MKSKNANPRNKFPISLKQIPPLDPSLIDNHNSQSNYWRPSAGVPTWVVKRSSVDRIKGKCETESNQSVKVEENEGEQDKGCGFSTKHIDPNSTQSVESAERLDPEKDLFLKIKPKIEIEDASEKVYAKAKLHEVCAAKRWKVPLFECCKEEGPCHSKLFTYSVVVEMVDSSSSTILECYGVPQTKKKTAAESAAEGVLWYLKHLGHFSTKRKQ